MNDLPQNLQQNLQTTSQLLGISLPTPAYLFGATVFGFVGLYAWVRGRRSKLPVCKWIGIALMFYPLVVPANTPMLYGIGIALCAAMFYWRDQ